MKIAHLSTTALVGLLATSLWGCVVHTHPQATTASAPATYEEGAGPEGDVEAEAEAQSADGLRPHPPVQCTGVEDIELRGVYIEAPEHGIHIAGSCTVVIIDSQISAAGYGIVISGSGDVVLENTTIEGGDGAIAISGTGDIRSRDSRFVGGQSISGTGNFVDDGGNSWQ